MNQENAPDNLSLLVYDLPDERIAKHPLDQRDSSQLLVYRDGEIKDSTFSKIGSELPANTTLFFNNTKVIPARLFFHKDTGALIEIFLLKPLQPSEVISQVMEATDAVTWECMVGNFKKWKDGQTLKLSLNDGTVDITLTASIESRSEMRISFTWDNANYSFAEIVELAGKIPLPPYLNREAVDADKERYQTVYSEKEGAVAAPTAGLHFTDKVLEELANNGVKESFLTLHVSAGTFQPIKVKNPKDHPMHSEQMAVEKQAIEDVINSEFVIPVGTTSMRTLESLYWFGVRLLNGNESFDIQKLEIYNNSEDLPARKESFQAILNWMNKGDMSQLIGKTEIFIMPGYQFRVCNGLITNFHQPGSTLLLLVSAFLKGNWKKVYNHALENNYRFLSYGDSSLLLP